jgi:RNA polymerase sigma-70 factor (ECF subfamily)
VGGERARLEEQYAPLRRFAAVVGPADVDPDDLVQEAMVQVLRRGGLDDIEDLGAYLRRTVVHLAANDRRSAGRRRRALLRLQGSARGASPPRYPSDVHELLRLPADVRAVLYLAEVEGLSYAEIGAALDITEEAARARASRGRRKLRLELEQEARKG